MEWRNARRVLVVMVLMLATMFSGISALAHQSGVVYQENGATLLYQLGERVFGQGLLLTVLQLATLLILLLAANTAYADFPRLAAFLAQDGYMPRQLASLGTGWCSATASTPSVLPQACCWCCSEAASAA